MKRYFYFWLITILLFLAIFNNTMATTWFPKDFIVGKQPMGVYYDVFNFTLHIFCGGFDANFNGIKDPGDENPSWWTITNLNGNNANKVREFEFGTIGFPFRPAILFGNELIPGKIFISHLGRIRCFSTDTYQLLDDTVANINASALSCDRDYLYISQRTNDSGFVIRFDYKNKKPVDTIPVGKFVAQTLPYTTSDNKKGLAILDEGEFGQNNSRLLLAEEQGSNFNITTYNIGDGGNHLSLSGDSLVVTVNGSGKILIFNLINKSLYNSIDTKTSLYDGPREALELGNKIYYTTYEGYLKVADVQTGDQFDSIKTHGKCEGIISLNYLSLAVANISLPDYSPDSVVTIYQWADGINENKYSQNSVLYPNPTYDVFSFEIDNNNQNAVLEITSLDGRVMGVFNNPNISDNKIKFVISTKEMNLSSGVYFARLKAGSYSSVKLFCIIK